MSKILDYHLGFECDGELYRQYFIRWLDKSKKMNKQEAFAWLKKNKDRFTPRMIEYAHSFYDTKL